MKVDVKSLLVELNFFAGDMAMRNMSAGRAKIRAMPDRLFDVSVNLNSSSFPTITWLKNQSVNVREAIAELESVAIDSYDGELYNTGQALLEKLNYVTARYTRSYVSFEELVNKAVHRNFREESPADILVKLADHSYALLEATAAFHDYLDCLASRRLVEPAHIEELREELEELEILCGLD